MSGPATPCLKHLDAMKKVYGAKGDLASAQAAVQR